MPDKNTRWQNDKEWAGWTIRDEIYSYIREHLGPIVSGAIGAAITALFAWVASHPTVAALIGGPAITLGTITILAVRDGKTRKLVLPNEVLAPRLDEPLQNLPVEQKKAPVKDRIPLPSPVETITRIEAKPQRSLSKEAERTIERARELDRGVAKREAARRAFNTFSPERPMTDLEEEEWSRLGVLFSVEVETVSNQEQRYLTLKFLPDRSPKEAFSLLLIMYGYREIYRRQDVRASVLEECLYRSRLRKKQTMIDSLIGKNLLFDVDADRLGIDGVAKSPALHGMISEKIHLAKGGFYELTEAGVRSAQQMFMDLVRRA